MTCNEVRSERASLGRSMASMAASQADVSSESSAAPRARRALGAAGRGRAARRAGRERADAHARQPRRRRESAQGGCRRPSSGAADGGAQTPVARRWDVPWRRRRRTKSPGRADGQGRPRHAHQSGAAGTYQREPAPPEHPVAGATALSRAQGRRPNVIPQLLLHVDHVLILSGSEAPPPRRFRW